MAEYTYNGVDRTGQKVSGRVDAATEGDLRMILRERGIRPTRIMLSGAVSLSSRITGRVANKSNVTVPNEVLVMFTRQLQMLVTSGIPLIQGLTLLEDQQENKTFKNIISDIREKVAQGSYFWEVLSTYPRVFPKLYPALIRAGENSGSLDQMLKRLTKYLENTERMRRLLKSAMSYPIIVISIGIGVVAIMLIYVIPKFEELLVSNGQELPGPTQFVIDLSHFIIHNLLWIVLGVSFAIYAFRRYIATPEGRAVLDRLVYRAPIFGSLVRKSGTARFCRTLQTLLTSGVNVIDAIDICKNTIDNVVLEDAVGRVRAEVETGKTMGSVLGRLNIFPKMAVEMITVGETTGSLDKMLEKVADFYEEEVEIAVAGVSKLIEPFVLVFLGGTVGGLMIAMYLPIFKMAGAN